MPLPMVHLLLAETIGEKMRKAPNSAFLLGSIAPDAIHMRPGSRRKDKHVTHFFQGDQWGQEGVQRQWELVEQQLAAHAGDGLEERAFVAGYYIHTLLDMIWIRRFFNVLANTLRFGGIGFEDIRTKYYSETNACDARIYQEVSWSGEVYRQLAEMTPMGFANFLSAKEVGLWRDVVLGKMRGYEQTVPGETFYITQANIFMFIEELAEEIVCFLQKRDTHCHHFLG